MFEKLPQNLDRCIRRGFDGVKLDDAYAEKVKAAVLSHRFGTIETGEVDHDRLYTQGTFMATPEARQDRILNDLAEALKIAFEPHLKPYLNGHELVADFFVSMGTKGYEVPWHSDCDGSCLLAIPIYFIVGEGDYQDGMLQFTRTSHLNMDEPPIVGSVPARNGFGAAIWSNDTNFSHRALKIESDDFERYFIRYTLSRR